jgi:hypothetical protein
MTSTDIAPVEQRRRPATPLNKPKRAWKVPAKQQVALKAIIWEGQELDEAAATAGLTTHALRCALAKPQVIAWMKAEREVLRAYVSAQNIHHAREMRNKSGNAMAKLGAMRFIEGIDEQHARGSGPSASPGVTIRVVTVVQSAPGQTYPSDMSRPDVKQINNLTNPDANAASAVDRGSVDVAPAIPEPAPRGGRGEK